MNCNNYTTKKCDFRILEAPQTFQFLVVLRIRPRYHPTLKGVGFLVRLSVKTISGPTVHLSERETISGQEIAFGDYTEGRYAWKLVNLDVLLDPIQAKGQLSLWEWNQDI